MLKGISSLAKRFAHHCTSCVVLAVAATGGWTAVACPPGFEFDEEQPVAVSGSLLTGVTLSLDTGDCWARDSYELDELHYLESCGPNDFSSSAPVLMADRECGGLSDSGTAFAEFSSQYTLLANQGVIAFNAGSAGDYGTLYTRMNAYVPPAGSGGSSAYGVPLHVTMLLYNNSAGQVTVTTSRLSVTEVGSAGRVGVAGRWSLAGQSLSIGDSYVLDGADVDEWTGSRVFPVEVGWYMFTAYYQSDSGILSWCEPPECPISETYHATDVSEVQIVYSCSEFLRCDANCDGLVNNCDVDPFVLAVADPEEYATEYPACSFFCNNAINGDGSVNSFDIDPLVECIEG